MGAWLSRIVERFAPGTEECRVVMLGLDAAGKTTALYKMHLGEVVTTIPTIGFNVQSVEYKGLSFNCWDVGGQKKIRSLWHHYYRGSHAIIFLVDSADRERLAEVREELWATMTHEELLHVPVLVYANKQDMPRAAKPSAIAEALDMGKLPHGRPWHVQGCCATSGDGLFDGLDWLSTAVKAARSARAGR